MVKVAAEKLLEEYSREYPTPMRCLQEDFEGCIALMEFPLGHHKAIRTTNLIEGAVEEYRRRSKVIPRRWGKRSWLKLIYGVLIRACERWRQVKMS